MNLYIKYNIQHNFIFDVIKSKSSVRTITFFIDLQSIARGLYNKKVVELEISNYDENRKIYTLPKELFEYLRGIESVYKKYDPFFIIFYDKGRSRYHHAIDSSYKSNRKILNMDSIYADIYMKLKDFYFQIIYETFNNYNNCIVLYLDSYESDFIPHYVISKGYLDSNNENNINIILSADKDLLQTTKFPNTYQYVVSYKNNKYEMSLYDKRNGLKYIYPRFKPGVLDTAYIPLILSIAGDSADNIVGIKGFGYKKAIDFIIKYQLRPDLSNIESVKDLIDVSLVKRNYKLISFDYLIEHINKQVLAEVDKFFV